MTAEVREPSPTLDLIFLAQLFVLKPLSETSSKNTNCFIPNVEVIGPRSVCSNQWKTNE